MPKMQKKMKRLKTTLSVSKFRKLVISRPDVLHVYLSHKEINQYLDYVGHRYAEFVTIHTLGRSYEGRFIKGIEINWLSEKNFLSLAEKTANNKAALPRTVQPVPLHKSQSSSDVKIILPLQGRNMVFIEGGTHGREWISISVALNCIFQLTEKYLRHQDLLRKLRFFIVPVSNPDGYEFTRTKNRRWRKNRRPQKDSKNIGTDCNRNYDFHWAEGTTKSSRNTFKGDKPFSEPETCALRNILQKLTPQLLFVLSLHSYAQSIMYPWGYSKDLPETWRQLDSLAVAGRNAIKSYNGRRYRVGSIASLTKRTIPGSIVDYAFGQLRIPLALVMELPSSDLGFQPPPELISQIGHESWFGIREMCKRAYDIAPPSMPQDKGTWVTVNKLNRLTRDKKQTKTKHNSKSNDSSSEDERIARNGLIKLTQARKEEEEVRVTNLTPTTIEPKLTNAVPTSVFDVDMNTTRNRPERLITAGIV